MKKRRMKTKNKGQRRKREENERGREDGLFGVFAVALEYREKKTEEEEWKEKERFIPALFSSLETQKKILTLQVLKRAPVGLLHDDRFPPRWFDSALFLSLRSFASFVFFSGEVEACARCACLLSNECRKEGGCFFVREIDKREREKFLFSHF